MRNQVTTAAGILLLTMLLSACTTRNTVIVPDTELGDQLKSEYMIGEWCTNRQETADRNRAAGISPMTNLTKLFWRFTEDGTWSGSKSGFFFESQGTWALEGLDTLKLSRFDLQPDNYRAQFQNGGTDLVLLDKKDQYLVLSLCE